MIYEVITHNQIIGSHYWEDAPDRFAYLRNLHRHVFVIRCKFNVTHTDRQIEINDMQDYIEMVLRAKFSADETGLRFEGMSCEDIARLCIGSFGCTECEVLEDGFGGACVKKEGVK